MVGHDVGDFLDLASMTSWLELLILIVELTMESSLSTGQVPPVPLSPPGTPLASHWLNGASQQVGWRFSGPFLVDFWVGAGLWQFQSCWGGTVGDYSVGPRHPHSSFQIYKDDLCCWEMGGGVLQGVEGC